VLRGLGGWLLPAQDVLPRREDSRKGSRSIVLSGCRGGPCAYPSKRSASLTNKLFPSVHPCLPDSSQEYITKETYQESPHDSAALMPLETSIGSPNQTERCQMIVEIFGQFVHSFRRRIQRKCLIWPGSCVSADDREQTRRADYDLKPRRRYSL
jgi:hypothetical protein